MQHSMAYRAERVGARRGVSGYGLRWLVALFLALGMVGPAWASCPSVVTLSVPAGGSIALNCPTDGSGNNWGFLEVDTSNSYTTPYGEVSLLDPGGDIYAAGYFNTSGAGQKDEFDLTDGSNNQPVHFIINIGPASIVANPVSATVAYGSGANPITLDITGGTPTSVAIGTVASHGSAVASGTSITYQPDAGFAGSDSFTYTASNAGGTSAPAMVSITVNPPTLSLTPAAGTLTLDYNVAYNQVFSAGGGAGPYSYALTGTLPAGLSFAAASGTLSGTPTQSGSFPMTVTATDSSTGTGAPFSVANNYTLQVNAATLTITPATLPAGTAGDVYSQSLAASGGTGPYTFSVIAGALPTGLSLAGDGTLSGTPSASGPFAFTVQAQDANGQIGTQDYNLTVSGATLTLAPSTLPDGAIGGAYSQSFSTTGGIAPYSYAITAGALPAGLVLTTSGTLSGTPTAGGTFNFDVQVSDSSGGTATVSYGLVIAAPMITLSPATLPDGLLDSAYSATISASGGTAPYSYAVTAGTLPAGLALSAAGALSGTPTASGTFNFDVTSTDQTGGTGPFSQTRSYALQINVPPPIANPVSATIAYGSGANPITLDITGGTPTAVTIGTAASHGSALASGTSITYQPNAGFAGSDSFTYTASNAGGSSAPATVSITVSPPTLSLAPAAGMLALDYNAAYSQAFSASGGAAPYSYALTGTLPAGLSFAAASGILSGTPTQSGSFPVTVTATDGSTGSGAPFSVANNYTLQVNAATLTITPATLPAGTAGDAYSQSLAASGGIGPYTFSVTAGALPTGLSLAADGTLLGTPSANGTFAFTVQAQDANDQVGTRAYSLTVSGATLTLAPSTLPDGTIGAAYSQSFSTTGGVAPYSYAITTGALPAGLALTTSGTLSGTPTASGTFNFDVQVRDSSGGTASSATVSYALVIAAPAITLSPATLPDGQLNSAYSATISASGGIAPYTYALASGTLPAGLSLASNGTLSGTPTEFGTFNFNVSATDSSTGSGPRSASQAYALTIADMAVVANPVSVTVAYGSGANPIALDITGGTPTAVAIGTAASHGTALASGTSITYQPDPGFTGSDSFSYTASNANGTSVPATVSITVSPPTVSLTPAAGTLTLGYNVAYSQTFSASGGAAPYSYALTGTLPAGLSFAAASGTLSGTPTQSGSFPVTVTATDSSTGTGAPFSVANNYTLQVNPATLTITPAALPAGTAGDAYSQSLAASGGIGPYTFSVTAGALPVGLSLASDGTLSGTPSANGPFAFTVQVQDANGQAKTHAYNLAITAATLTLAPATLPEGIGGVPYSQSFSTTGGVAPYSYAITTGALPAGLTLAADGILSGTSTVSGTFNFDVRVSDSSGGTPSSATVSYALQITVPAITLTPPTLPAGIIGTHYAQTLSASGGVAPYRYTISAGALPGGMALATQGSLSGALTASGKFAFTVRAQDANGFSGTRDYSIVIEARSDPSKDPEVLGLLTAQTTATRRFARAQIGNFQQRLESLHGGGGAGFANGFTVPIERPCRDAGRRGPGDCGRMTFADAPPLAVGPVPAVIPTPTSPLVASSGGPFGLWTAGALRFGDFDARRGGSEGFKFETTGISVGADYRTGPTFAFGAGIGYGHDESDIGDNGSRSEADSYNVTLYASYHPGDHVYLDGLLGYQLLSFQSRRYVTDNGNRVSGERDAAQWFASISSGYEIQLERLGIASYARLNVARARIDGYTEQGDDTFALAYRRQDVETTTTSLGMRLDYGYLMSWGLFSPQLRLEYQRDFQDQSIAAMRYADLTGPLYRAGIAGFDRSRFVTGIGAALYTDNDFDLRVEYRRRVGSSSVSVQSVRLTVEKRY